MNEASMAPGVGVGRVGGVGGVGPAGPLGRLLRPLAGLLAILLLTAAARAQSGVRTTGLKLEVDPPGVGGVIGDGGLVGIRVKLTDSSLAPRSVAVRLAMKDSDGDEFVSTRIASLTPGIAVPVWVYGRLPPDAGKPLVLGVYPLKGDGGDPILDEPLARVELGSGAGGRFNRAENCSLLLRIGQAQLGLARYTASAASPVGPHFLQEPVRETGVRVADLPDNWMGLAQFSTIVWGEGEPGELRGAYSQAVREWILEGGHLVIVLPAAGQTWLGPAGHELSDLMPEIEVLRKDGADLKPYTPLLTRQSAPASPRGVIYELKPRDGAVPSRAMPILSGPGGDCVVVRRLVGCGAVTVIGLDLARNTGIEVDADVFWHRVLGTRGQLLKSAEIPAQFNSAPSLSPVPIDKEIETEVAKLNQGNALGGVFLGLVVFVLYWLTAGPGSYAILRRSGLVRHAWVAFTAAAGVFTLIAWGGSWALRPKDTDGRHVTLYEEVYGQKETRARSFFSVMLPWYGEARFGVGGMDGKLETGSKRTLRNSVGPWPSGESGVDDAFPDTRPYVLDVTTPSSMAFPARSTVKQLQTESVHGTLWGMPYPVNDAGEPGGEIAVVPDPNSPGVLRLKGSLKHKLPAPLRNITIFYVGRQRSINNAPGYIEGSLAAVVNGWVFKDTREFWDGSTLDLGAIDERARANPADFSWASFLEAKVQKEGWRAGIDGQVISPERMMQLLTVAGQAAVPRLNPNGTITPPDGYIQIQRKWTQRWDATRWMTQPCLIIIGELSGPSPTPVYVDGRELPTKGSTWIRWIYPLPAEPPQWRSVTDAADQKSDKPEPGKPTSK